MSPFGLRARFVAVGILIALTTVAATAWTLVVLSRVVADAATTVADGCRSSVATWGALSPTGSTGPVTAIRHCVRIRS